ncbi:MAG: DUF3822 family protein [Bacteroidales bacterium]|jgi:hypothetical protein|nr:DUF3822 family protein [Bacteroidales bacterium]
MPETGNNPDFPFIDLVDETFDVSRSTVFVLSVQIGGEGLSYCLFDTVVNKFVVLRHYPLDRQEDIIALCGKVFESDEWLKFRYRQSRVMWVSPRSTMVPEDLLDERCAEQILNFNHDSPSHEEQTFVRHLPSQKLYHLFSVPVSLVRLLSACQPDIRWLHHAQLTIEGIAAKKTPVSLFFYRGYMDTALFRNKQFLFYNSFPVNSPVDAFYFLAGVEERFNMPLIATEVACSGTADNIPSYLEYFKSHSLRVTECESGRNHIYSHYITESLQRRFAYLFHLHECVS